MNESASKKSNIDTIINNIYINEIVFISLIILSFLGDVIGDVSDRAVIFYWILMLPVFFIASALIEKAGSLHHKNENECKHYIRFEIVLWGGAFVSVILVMLLWHAEIIKAAATGLIIHIILAQTMFISGIILGLRFYLIGLFLFLIAALSITIQGMIGVTLMLAIPFIFIGLYIEKHYFFPIMKRNYNGVSQDNDQ